MIWFHLACLACWMSSNFNLALWLSSYHVDTVLLGQHASGNHKFTWFEWIMPPQQGQDFETILNLLEEANEHINSITRDDMHATQHMFSWQKLIISKIDANGSPCSTAQMCKFTKMLVVKPQMKFTTFIENKRHSSNHCQSILMGVAWKWLSYSCCLVCTHATNLQLR